MITKQTGSPSWLISMGFHAALLVGMTLVVIERVGSAAGSGGYGMSCAIAERGLGIERIERPPDHFGSKGARPAPPPFLDDLRSTGSQQDLGLFWDRFGTRRCCPCQGEAADGPEEFLRPLASPEPPGGFEYRRRSLEENRTGMPRLRKPWRAATSPRERFGRWPIDCDHQTVLSAAAISDDQLGDGLRCTGCGWPWWVIRASSW